MKTKLVLKSFSELPAVALELGSQRSPEHAQHPPRHAGEGRTALPLTKGLALLKCARTGRWLPVTVHKPCPGAE